MPLRYRAKMRLLWALHRGPVHPGWRHPLRFMASGGCWVCRWATRDLPPPPAFEDLSTIEVRKPEPGRRGIVLSATAKRQLEKIIADDPSMEKLLWDQINAIAEDPGD